MSVVRCYFYNVFKMEQNMATAFLGTASFVGETSLECVTDGDLLEEAQRRKWLPKRFTLDDIEVDGRDDTFLTMYDITIMPRRPLLRFSYLKTEEIINMTSHEITIHTGRVVNGREELFTIPPADESETLRIVMKVVDDPFGLFDGRIKLTQTIYDQPLNVPEVKPDRYYIVSQLVKMMFPHRKDFLVPANLVKNDNQMIVGCRALGR